MIPAPRAPYAPLPSGPRPALRALRGALLTLLLTLLAGGLHAQGFDAGRYYQQCLRFEAGGDLETAKGYCLNALQVDPDMSEAGLALARIQVGLGEDAQAESRILALPGHRGNAEALLLLADIAFRAGRLDEAEARLAQVAQLLEERYNSTLAARHAFLEGSVAKRRGRFEEALESYRRAIDTEPLDAGHYLATAELLLRLGYADAARGTIERYREVSGEPGNAALHALAGRTYWASGQLLPAARELETAFALRGGRETEAQASDLRSLALIYYGSGDARSGNLALRDALRRGNLLEGFMGNNLLWLLALLALVGTHLLAESRLSGITSPPEPTDGPEQWTVGHVYSVLATAGLLGMVAAFAYGAFGLGNYLALFTPLQGNELRAVFFVVFTLAAVAMAARRVRTSGWGPLEKLVGSAEQLPLGVGIGVLLLAALLAYLRFLPQESWFGPFYLDLQRLTPLVVAAMVVIPFSELFFRGFALPAFTSRYGRASALLIGATLPALVFGTPLLLLVGFGLALGEAFLKSSSGLVPLVAQLTLHLGLLLAIAFMPWVQGLLV